MGGGECRGRTGRRKRTRETRGREMCVCLSKSSKKVSDSVPMEKQVFKTSVTENEENVTNIGYLQSWASNY